MNDYELEIISKDKKSKNKVFKSHELDGIKTIGVKNNEPFALRFKNNTYNDVQVRLSVDGTDVITGELASTNPTGEMWFVKANSSMEIEAWPETNSGGAKLVFGKEGASVAMNTHGNMSAKGLIAAAVFVEGYKPWYVTNASGPKWTGNTNRYDDTLFRSRSVSKGAGTEFTTQTLCSTEINEVSDSAPAVGAGEYTEQTITKTAGLTTPKFKEVVQFKYEWWNTLKKTLDQYVEPPVAHNAFPGDEKMIDIKNTPRVRTSGVRRRPRRQPRYGGRGRTSSQRFV